MSNRVTKQALREAILKDHPLFGTGDYRQLPPDSSGRKTTLMLNVEARFGESIEKLVVQGSLNEVARRLGVNRYTVLRWRQKFSA